MSAHEREDSIFVLKYQFVISLGSLKNLRPIQAKGVYCTACSSASAKLSEPRGYSLCNMEANEATHTGQCIKPSCKHYMSSE